MKSKLLAPLLLMLSAVASQVALAADVPTPASILASTPPGDKSVEIFTHLLGTFFSNPLSTIASAPTLIGSLFLVFNAAVFVVGMLWASFGLISGIVETANTGEVLGKRLSAVWLPIRMVTGIAGIVPVFGGFSLAQVFIISMTSLGIGIANGMWVKAIDAVNEFATLSPPSVMASGAGGSLNFETAAEDLFLMHVCRIASAQNAAAAAAAGVADPVKDKVAPTQVTTAFGALVAMSSPNKANLCGKAMVVKTYVDGRSSSTFGGGFRVASVHYDAFAGQVANAYTANFVAFSNVVGGIADKWYEQRVLAQNTAGASVHPYPKDLLNNAAQNYAASVQLKSEAVAVAVKSETTALTKEASSNMRATGWIGAGMWYSSFAEANAAMADAMKSVAYSFESPQVSQLPPAVQSDLGGITPARQANAATKDSSNGASTNDFALVSAHLCSLSGVLPPGMCAGMVQLGGAVRDASSTPTGNVSLGQGMVKLAIDGAAVGSGGSGLINPIIMFKNLGDYTMGVAEAIFVVQGAVTGKLGGPLLYALQSLGTALAIIAPYMLILGMLMAIYIPMIPFITWMGGVVQYAVVVCQGLVGAPIAALSHLEAEGEGLGRRTEAGYMFVLNVLFRPALMLFGFFLASALMVVIGSLQVKLFVGAMASAQGNSITGFMSFIGFLTIFFMINVTLIQGLFNMIFLLPDQVLGLIGSHGHMADIGKETENKIHGVFMNFGSKMQNMAIKKRGARASPKT